MTFHRTTDFASAPIGQETAEIASPLASKPHVHGEHASHVTDFLCWKALADLRAMGACGRRSRKLTDDEFDYNQFGLENGDGETA